MRPPAELDLVQWHTLTHAYGSAEDVPELIRALYDEDEETAEEAVDELYGNIHHQGSVYQASGTRRPLPRPRRTGQAHPDEELRALARRLLAVG